MTVEQTVQYLMEKGWRLMEDGRADNDKDKINRGLEYQKLAEQLRDRVIR